ncbi:hypothetical protein DY000_02006314 [Brassica cretica]|uniref:Uncharacterized protein n=1 Tax=Brassica cretica TaxID=69181 RepID=A0ABQ7CFN6_BRACR|nr:hypothetical protein DY000_02006314 [Brassica cretica]
MVFSRFDQPLRRGEEMSMRDGETRGSDMDAGETKASSCKGRDGGAGAVAKPELETKARGRRRSQTRLAQNTKRQTWFFPGRSILLKLHLGLFHARKVFDEMSRCLILCFAAGPTRIAALRALRQLGLV